LQEENGIVAAKERNSAVEIFQVPFAHGEPSGLTAPAAKNLPEPRALLPRRVVAE
jgi:hypothetical protein